MLAMRACGTTSVYLSRATFLPFPRPPALLSDNTQTLQALAATRDFSFGAACVLLLCRATRERITWARGQAANEPITRLTLLDRKQ
jgi:hypothetical protein